MGFLFPHVCVSVSHAVPNLLITDTSAAERLPWLVLLLYVASMRLFGYQLAIYLMEFTSTMYDLHFKGILITFFVIFWKAGVNLKNVSSQR